MKTLIFLRIIDVTVSQELLETPKLDDRVTIGIACCGVLSCLLCDFFSLSHNPYSLEWNGDFFFPGSLLPKLWLNSTDVG